jgi:hypothetical protein
MPASVARGHPSLCLTLARRHRHTLDPPVWSVKTVVDPRAGLVYGEAVMAARASSSLASWRRDAIRRIQAVRRSTLAFVRGLPERDLRQPRTQDRWSVKDVLGHLMSCDEETARRFRLIASGRGDRIYWFESMADAHRFNARTTARARRLSLPALLERMARAHTDVVEGLKGLPLEALRDPSHEYPVVEWLPTPGWTHERDHVDEVRGWWREQRASRAGQRGKRPARAAKRR